MNTKVKISILTPVYNVEGYLVKCIESVLQQSYTDFEFIIVDDGSTDESGVICDKYADMDNRIQVYHKKNEGLLATRRFAFSKASGDFYFCLDSDDFLANNALEKLVGYIESTNCDCVVFNYARYFDGKIWPSNGSSDQYSILDNKHDIFVRMLFNSKYNAIWRKIFKASLLDGRDYTNYYHIKMGEDLLQSLEIYENSNRIVIVPDILYYYNYNPNSITQTVTRTKYNVDFTVREEVLKCIQRNNCFSDQEKDNLLSRSIQLFLATLYTISSINCSKNKKYEYYNEVKSSEYYNKYLLSCLEKDNVKIPMIFRLFVDNKYGLLQSYCSCIRAIRSIKDKIRR